jgi:hypothetical protein
MAVIGAAEPRENRFVPQPPAGEIVRRVTAAADGFHDEIMSILQACKRQLPDWWTSGWRNARSLAEQFAKQLGRIPDWPQLATEWTLDSTQRIQLGGSNELRVRGRIDLLLARNDQAQELWIVDYKTGNAEPLKSNAEQLRKQLVRGDGIQICIYALALQNVCRNICSSLLTRDANFEHTITLDDIVAQNEIWREIARMQDTGIFGMLGELRSEFTFTGIYPLATLEIDKDLLKQKWERTHPPFADPTNE